MKKARCFNTLDELKQYAVEYNCSWCGDETFNVEDLVLGEPTNGDDDRIGWRNNRYIYTKRRGSTDYMQKYGCVQCVCFVGEVDDNYVPEKWRAWRYWHRKYLYEQFFIPFSSFVLRRFLSFIAPSPNISVNGQILFSASPSHPSAMMRCLFSQVSE